MPHPEPIRIEALREIASAGAVRAVVLVGQRGGWALVASVGMAERVLANRTRQPRLFATIDMAAKSLRALGIADFAVRGAGWAAGRLRPAARVNMRKSPNPDRTITPAETSV